MAKIPGLYRRGNIWWTKVYVNGRAVRESAGTEKETEAKRILDKRRGAVATGAPIPPRLDRILYDELARDLRTFYETTGKRRLDEVDDRLAYLDRFFRGRRAASITPALITEYVAARQVDDTRGRPPANRTIKIELAILKRMLRLAARRDKRLRVPAIDMLKDAPAREGFFEEHQYDAVRRLLPADLQVAVAIMHTYGWRRREVLTLERRQLDLKAGTLRLDPGATKNSEGRVVYLTPTLKTLLAGQVDRVEALQRQLGRIVPALFPHGGKGSRAGAPRRGLQQAVGDGVRGCRRARAPAPRLPANGSAEPRAPRGRPFGGHEDHRAQDRERVSALRHRERRLRPRRNELAHQAGAIASWPELKEDRGRIHEALHAQGLVDAPKALQFFLRRSGIRDSTRAPEFKWERDFEYGVTEDGIEVLTVKWTQQFAGLGQ